MTPPIHYQRMTTILGGSPDKKKKKKKGEGGGNAQHIKKEYNFIETAAIIPK